MIENKPLKNLAPIGNKPTVLDKRIIRKYQNILELYRYRFKNLVKRNTFN